MYVGIHVSCWLFLFDFRKTFQCWQILVRTPSTCYKFTKLHPVGAEYSVRTDEQTVLTKPVVAVRNFANSAENCSKLSGDYQYCVREITKIFVNMLLNALGSYISCWRTRRVCCRVYWFVRNVLGSRCVIAFIETKNTGNVALNFQRHLVWNFFLMWFSSKHSVSYIVLFIHKKKTIFLLCAVYESNVLQSYRYVWIELLLTRTARTVIVLPENVSRHNRQYSLEWGFHIKPDFL